MGCSLTTRTAYLNIIITLKGYDEVRINSLLLKLKDFCDESFKVYAYILHDKDINEDGSAKTPHVHLVGIYHTNRQRLSTILNDLSCHIEVNALAISIDKCSDFAMSVQYLIHRNNENKYHYALTSICSNLQINELQQYMERESTQLSTTALLDIVSSAKSKVEVYSKIGLEYYRQYRQVINDLWFELHEKDSLFACTQFSDNG